MVIVITDSELGSFEAGRSDSASSSAAKRR